MSEVDEKTGQAGLSTLPTSTEPSAGISNESQWPTIANVTSCLKSGGIQA